MNQRTARIEALSAAWEHRISNCFVASDGEGQVAGCETLATSLPLTVLTDEEKRRLPRYALLPA